VKLLFLGNREECLGFALAGAEGIEIKDEETFSSTMERLLEDEENGLIIASDRFFEIYEKKFAKAVRKRAIPAIVFVPSIEGKYLERDIRGYLSGVLGIRF